MTINILDLAKSTLTENNIKTIADFVGESASNVQTALQGIFPAILTGILDKAFTTKDVFEIVELIKQYQEERFFDDFSDKLSNSATAYNLLSSGNQILQILFGQNLEALTNCVSQCCKIKKPSVSLLLIISASFLINSIGQYLRSTKIEIAKVSKFFAVQRSFVDSALSIELSSVLNSQNENVTENKSGGKAIDKEGYVAEEVYKKLSWRKKLILKIVTVISGVWQNGSF